MNFDDFLEVYYLVHFNGKEAHKSVAQRRGQLYFHVFKQHGGTGMKNSPPPDNVMKDHFNSNLFLAVGTQYFNMTDQQVIQFLQSNGLQPNQKVTLCKLSKCWRRLINYHFQCREVPADIRAEQKP